jgi:hypothetical protein
MGLASQMKNLTDELLGSFKQRIRENEELVNDVQKTLDGFRKDQQEMAAVLNANAAALRKGLARGEKDRLSAFNGLMSGIHGTIASIQQEVVGIQTSTMNMINEFSADREQMSVELDKSFAQERADRLKNEKNRMKEFDSMMKSITNDIKNINGEVLAVFKTTNDMIDRFEKEHQDMSAELKAELGKNLAERVEYTRSLLKGFQKRLSDISKENQKMAQNLRKDLANGETVRMSDYNGIMKGIHVSIKGIRKEVRDIQKVTAGMLGDLLENRVQASADWDKMQQAMAGIRKTGVVSTPRAAAKKAEKKAVKKEAPIELVKETVVAAVKEAPIKLDPKPELPMTLENKVLNYINKHPKGVKVSEMEEPLNETRMKLGYTAKGLLDEGKVQKIDNIYYPIK